MQDQRPDRATTIRSGLHGRSIVLVGLMGAGKSAIGRQIATALDLPFCDADTEIEAAARLTIPEIFESYGEPEFRRLEQRVIERLLDGPSIVLATGGGAWMNEDTRNATAHNGISLWLSAELDILMERVGRKSHRPLLQNADPRAVMERLMNERNPVYALADLEIRSENVSKEVMADRVLQCLYDHLTAMTEAPSEGSSDHARP